MLGKAFRRCASYGCRNSEAASEVRRSYGSRIRCTQTDEETARPVKASSRKVRLERLMSNLGYCSRAEVAVWLRQGRITTLEGSRIPKASVQVHPEEVLVDGEPLDPMPPLALMMDKPTGYTCSASDPAGGALVYDLLPHRFAERSPTLASVGRLDKDTSGLLLMTDDGQLLHNITSPKRKIWKVYDVTLARPLEGGEAATFLSGGLVLRSEDDPLLPAHMLALAERRALLAICEGRYHQVRRMFAAVGNHVEALRRVSVGGLELVPGGRLAPGAHWCVATPSDLAAALQEGVPDLAALATRLGGTP